MDRPLYQMPTPTLIVGRNACAVLRPLFDRMGYGPETATFADTVGDARGRLDTMPPPALLIIEEGEGADAVVCRICQDNPDLRVMALGDGKSKIRADMRLPLQVSYEVFSTKYHDLALAFAMSAGGFRGEVDASLKGGCARDCDQG